MVNDIFIVISKQLEGPLVNQSRTSCTPTSCPPLSVRHLAKLSRSHNTESREDTARANLPELWRERDFTDASWPRKVATRSQESVEGGGGGGERERCQSTLDSEWLILLTSVDTFERVVSQSD